MQHFKEVKHLLRYLAATADYTLVYDSSHDNESMEIEPKLIGYCDVDLANDMNERKSISGYVFKLGNSCISWKSTKQSIVALSTVEAEYVSASEAAREAMWWRQFLNELGFDMAAPTTIFSDSQGGIRLTKNPEFHKRTKHIDIKYHFVRNKVQENQIILEYIHSKEMIADALTKPLPRDQHHYLIGKMGIRPDASFAGRC